MSLLSPGTRQALLPSHALFYSGYPADVALEFHVHESVPLVAFSCFGGTTVLSVRVPVLSDRERVPCHQAKPVPSFNEGLSHLTNTIYTCGEEAAVEYIW